MRIGCPHGRANPFERALCVFGLALLDAVLTDPPPGLGAVLRCDRRPRVRGGEAWPSSSPRVRADLEAPKMPFGVGEVFDDGKRDAVRAAQKAVAGKVKGAFFVPADRLRTFDGGTHFDAASQVELGERFAAGMAKAIGKE
jgi:hypothetical protein